MKKQTAFSLADKLDEAGSMVVARRSDARKSERVIHYEAADMIRSLAIKLHRERSQSRIICFICFVGWFLLGLSVSLSGK